MFRSACHRGYKQTTKINNDQHHKVSNDYSDNNNTNSSIITMQCRIDLQIVISQIVHGVRDVPVHGASWSSDGSQMPKVSLTSAILVVAMASMVLILLLVPISPKVLHV